MKMKKEHFDHMKGIIDDCIHEQGGRSKLIKKYEGGGFPKADKVKDLQKRFCFDLFYYAGLNQFTCSTLYGYLNDDHIYTALKAICPKVERKY